MNNLLRLKFIAIITLLASVLLSNGHRLDQAQAMISDARPFVKETNGKYSLIGLASWYSRKSPGINKHTANNEIFDDNSMTCAMWGTEFNSIIRVTNIENGRSVVLRVNDRGPHNRYFRQGRLIDMTKNAFQQISDPKKGLAAVKIEFL